MSKNLKIVITSILVIVLGVAGVVFAETIVNNFYGEATVNMPDGVEASLGAVTAVGGVCNGSEPTTQLCNVNTYELESQTTITSPDVVVTDDLTVNDDALISGDLTLSGSFIAPEKVSFITPATQYATTTLTAANSGTTYVLSGPGNLINLPSKTATGTFFRFVIGGAADTANFVIASAEGDNIEGTLIVAGAVVDCDAEDFLNFVVDGENIGDYVEVMSIGTAGWAIVDSGVLTSGKLTCTDPS